MAIINQRANLKQGEILETEIKGPQSKFPPYIPIGRGGMSKFRIQGIDMPPILRKLSKAATWLFWTSVDTRNEFSNKVILTSLTPTEKSRLHNGYNELENNKLFLRVSKGVYMLNPKAVLPNPISNFEAVWEEWKQRCYANNTPHE